MAFIQTAITFNNLSFPTGYTSIGSSYSESGYNFVTDTGNLNVTGPTSVSYPGSGSITPDFGSTMTITKDNGDLFGISQMGIAELLGNTAGGTLAITGVKADDSLVNYDFSLDGGAVNTQTFVTSLLEQPFKSFSFTQDTLPGAQFDSFELVSGFNDAGGSTDNPPAAVPAPDALGLTLIGLAALKGAQMLVSRKPSGPV